MLFFFNSAKVPSIFLIADGQHLDKLCGPGEFSPGMGFYIWW